jgi:large repetitive protein
MPANLLTRWLEYLSKNINSLSSGSLRSRRERSGNPRHGQLLSRPTIEFLEDRITPTLVLNPPTLPVDTIGVSYSQADVNSFYADQVVSYVPGTLADPSYDNPAAALGGLNPVTGSYNGTNYYLTPFDPAYSSSDLVEIGAGGSMILKLSQTASTTGYTIGVHTGFGLNDADYPDGTNTNPASYFNSWLRQADVLVSADGVNWGNLGTITFDNPSNYYAGSTTNPEGLTPGVGPLANVGEPFLGSLSSFNGQNWQETLSALNGSAGGTWLNLSGVTDENGNPIMGVNYIEFVVPANPPLDPNTGNPELMMVDAVVGTNSDTGITTSGGIGAVTLTVSNINNPIAGLNVPMTGTNSLPITGTPTASGTETFTVTATDSASDTAIENYSIAVNPAVALGNPILPADTINAAYNQMIAASGGTGQIAYSVSNIQNAISGLSVPTSSIGALDVTGTPTVAGTETFTVTATDSLGVSTTGNYAITVNPSSSISIHTTSLPVATVGDTFSTQLSATGGTGEGYSFAASGLPAGLTLSSSGLLSGVPVATAGLPDTVTVSVLVDDSENDSGFRAYSVTVDPALTIGSSVLGTATVGDAIHTQLAASGGSGKGYQFKGVNLPSWLTLSRTGLLAGAPPATAGSTVDFSVEVTDSDKATASTSYTLQVDPALVISPTTLTVVTVGNAFSTQLTAAGGSGSGYTFTGSSMPAWMKLSSQGLLSGTPSVNATSPIHFTVVVRDGTGGTVERAYSLSVNPAVTLETLALPVATVGEQYSLQLTATGGSGKGYSFLASGLPEGLTLWSTGLLSGIPSAITGLPTTLTVTIAIADSNDAAGNRTYSLTVDLTLTIGPTALGTATVGDAFHTQLSALGGSGTGYHFKGVDLPSWLRLSSNGLLTGTPPTSAGSTVDFSVEVTDSDKATVSTTFALQVDPALLISPTTLKVVTVGNAFSTQLTAAGGSGSGYTFTGSGLPSWMNLSSEGLLSGTPVTTANFPSKLTVTVTDSIGATFSQTYSLHVISAPVPGPARLPVATVDDSYSAQLTATGGSGSGYSFTAVDLPSWLTLSSTGALSGTPTAATGSPVSFTVTVTDSNNATGSLIYALTVDPELTLSPTQLGVATVGDRLSMQLTAAGGSGTGYTFKGVDLPTWLTLSSSGLLTGTPPASAGPAVNFSVAVTDSLNGALSTSYTMHIDSALVIDPALPAATVGDNYETQLHASGGSGSGYTFTSANLPTWLTLSPSGELTGMPIGTKDSTVTFAVTVTDSEGATDTVTFQLTVQVSTVH